MEQRVTLQDGGLHTASVLVVTTSVVSPQLADVTSVVSKVDVHISRTSFAISAVIVTGLIYKYKHELDTISI